MIGGGSKSPADAQHTRAYHLILSSKFLEHYPFGPKASWWKRRFEPQPWTEVPKWLKKKYCIEQNTTFTVLVNYVLCCEDKAKATK